SFKMATMVRLKKDVPPIVDECYERKNEAEAARANEFRAIVRIQAWFRGQRVRAYIRHLHKCAGFIQARWRGYLGRIYYRICVQNSVFIMKMNHYNAMATKVQKIWRGYYTRKYISNYYSRKRYLEGLQVKNEIVRNELEEYAEQQEMIEQRKREMAEKKLKDDHAAKTHYLVSTEVIPGIYNSPFLPFDRRHLYARLYPSEKEYLLRSTRPRSHKIVEPKEPEFDATSKSYSLPKHKPLPPIGPKPQGPFRDAAEVQAQRYKPFQPSLRVATNYLSVEEAREAMKAEEWVNRINDNTFQPFSRRDRDYEPLLHTTSQFGHLPYGTNYFREEKIDKHVVQQSFQSVVAPIPILEKLNDTYSQGQV
ncbi:unnamed protein product, partial [Owenia fusiformis]